MKTVSGLTFLALILWTNNASAQFFGGGTGPIYSGNMSASPNTASASSATVREDP